MEYTEFSKRVAEDEEFVLYVEGEVEKMWEIDMADWEYSTKGIKDWTAYSLG